MFYANNMADYYEVDSDDEDIFVTVYTDGSCKNQGTDRAYAGIGVWFGSYNPKNLGEPYSGEPLGDGTPIITNNRAEFWAVKRALDQVDFNDDLRIYSDSEYVINVLTKWYPNWKRNDALEGKKNLDIITVIDLQLNQRKGKTTFTYVRGHNGDFGNEMADKLANQGAALALIG